MLAALLERPGQVVRREDLCRRLWPGNIFVDFDQGLNKAINKIREALDDDAEHPRYIETLPRRGYRLITSPSGRIRPHLGDDRLVRQATTASGRPGESNTAGGKILCWLKRQFASLLLLAISSLASN